MAVDLTRMILKLTSTSQNIEVLPWPRAYHIAITQPNILLFTVTRTSEREKIFTLLGPIANGEIAIYMRNTYDRSKVTLQSLKNELSIATHRGTAFQKILEKKGFQKIIAVNSSVNAVKMLMSGRADAICDDDLAIDEIFRQAGYYSKPFSKVMLLASDSLYFAFSKGTDMQIITKWKTAFEEIKRNGQFKQLYKKWFPRQKAPTEVFLLIPPIQPSLSLYETNLKTPDVLSDLLKVQLFKDTGKSN